MTSELRPTFCLFFHQQALRRAWVRDRLGHYLELMEPDGGTERLTEERLVLTWQGDPIPPNGSAETEALRQLRAHEAELTAGAAAVDLDALWAALPKGDHLRFDALAAHALPPDANGWRRAALAAALVEDRQRFQWTGAAFAVLTPQDRAKRDAKARRKAERAAWRANVQAWAASLEAGRAPEDAPGYADFLAMLQDVAAFGRRSTHWKALTQALELAHLHEDERPAVLRRWLEVADAWPGWPALWLRWGGVDEAFGPELLAAAEALAAAPVETAGRVDYRGQETVTIDAAQTLDYDDAFTLLEAGPKAVRVAVHMAAPPEALHAEHPVFAEAARRMASVYTVHGDYPMFPLPLSEGRFSLLAGADREALTLRLRLSDAGCELEAAEPSVVRVTANLSYAQGAALLREQPETWGRLSARCDALADRRYGETERPARYECWIDTSDPEHLRLLQDERTGPEHRLIEELAILYNTHAGAFCHDHGLPAIYRVQPAPAEAGQPPPPAAYTTRGGRHAGLGAFRYAQATAPIRRFPDLVVQRQMLGQLQHGRPAFAEESVLDEWARAANRALSLYNEVERRIFEDWMLRYLEQNLDAVHEGTVRRAGPHGHGRVWLPALLIGATAHWRGTRHKGDPVRLRVTQVDRDRREVQGEVLD